MARKYKVKCPYCGEYFYREDTPYQTYKNRFYHQACYEKLNKRDLDREKLDIFIKKLFKTDRISPLIRTQIKKYVEEEKYTYSGILGTLDYFYFIKRGDLSKAKGIGIVPYVYEEAKKYYENLQTIEEENKNFVFEQKQQDIFIKRPYREPIKKIYEIEIDMEDCDE